MSKGNDKTTLLTYKTFTIMTKKSIKNNGHEFVDLGLPSGTLWASINVGAASPEETGAYFQWGGLQGYLPEQIGTDGCHTDFSIESYDLDKILKYKKGARLKIADDAARVNWGGLWHIPTYYQIAELLASTKSEWTRLNGVSGRLFTSIKDKTKSIFIPAGGDVVKGTILDTERYGLIWSSTLNKEHSAYAKYLGLWYGATFIGDDVLSSGLCIRAVIG